MTSVEILATVVFILASLIVGLLQQAYGMRKDIDNLSENLEGDGYYNGKVGLRASVADMGGKYQKVTSSLEEMYELLIPQLTKDHKKDIDLYVKVKLSDNDITDWNIRYRSGELTVFFKAKQTYYPIHLKLSTLLERVAELKDLKDKLCCKKA